MSTIEQDPNSQNSKFCKEVAKVVFSVCRITNIYILIAIEWEWCHRRNRTINGR